MQLKIGLAQMDVVLGDPARNWATVQRMAAEARDRDVDLLVFPELWSTGYDLAAAESYATSTDAGMFAAVAELARTHRIGIAGSCLSRLGAGAYGNTAVLHNAQGEQTAVYSKTHLFRLMDEDQYLTAGDRGVVAETAWGRVGLAICYDLRFPELWRGYALAGARLALLPAEWPQPRLAHWQILLRARAIENQMFVAACNRVGRSKDAEFFGHSCLIDPWGSVLVEGDDQEGLLTADVDLTQVDAVRAQIPVFADRRPDVYAALAASVPG